MSRGYEPCGCRDCMEVAIGGADEDGPAMCDQCENNGCSPGGDQECSAEHAYCGGGEGVTIEGVEYCGECGSAF